MEENPRNNEKKLKSTSDVLTEKKGELIAMKENRSASVSLTIKTGTITTSNVTAVDGGLSMILNTFEGGITPLPRAASFIRNLFRAVPTSGSTISYAEMKSPDGGAGMTAEGALKSQADFDLVEAKANVRKVTAFIKTSKEALEDIEGLSGEINGELRTLVDLKADAQVLSGDGLTNNLSGILTNATAFNGGGLTGTIPAPNNYDVLVAAATQIQIAEVVSGEPAGFMANVIVLHPVDVAAMKLTKDKNDNYVFPITQPNGSVMEIPVVSNVRMTQGTFLAMDTTKGNMRIREDININIGYENDDFTKNLVTILAEMRLAFFIKSQHTKAFVKGTFATAKADLLGIEASA